MRSVETLVVGAGLAGLSTAYHLERFGRRDVLLVEKAGKVGGRASTEEKDGFLFDQTGHLLHLHDPYGRRLVARLLAGNLVRRERSAWIFSNKVFTRYPFQANTYGLPPRVVEDCVALFVKTKYRPVPLSTSASFEEWCLATFGEGICRHFMFPYNAKLWRARLSGLTTEWQGRFVPTPAAEEVLYGALRDQKKFFGYNSAFLYPARGGIQALADAFAQRVRNLRLNSPLERVDLERRVAHVGGLGEVRYENLVSTMALPFLLDRAVRLSGPVRKARAALRWRDVYNLNLGIGRAESSGRHWVYFPEERFAFYRAGFLTNFSKGMAPKGAASIYTEISRRPGEKADLARLERRILAGLRSCGLVRASDRVLAKQWNRMECAYVLYDRERTPAVKAIQEHLLRRGARSIGRWGAWKYSFMEESILDGKRCAEALAGRERRESAAQENGAELRPLR